ncbi:MAG: type II toxin-antitoxin system PemK/MazF family toxin [Anaeroplasmataceae bacterium]|nr:type II toxin-antitoxin system PemK/MazF family toxin [Anaeroplasmataceae bacterium]
MSTLKVRRVYKYIDEGVAKYFVYIGDSDNSKEILAGEIANPDGQRQYHLLENMSMVLFMDELLIIHPTTKVSELYISGKVVDINPFIFQSLINSLCKVLLNDYTASIVNMSSENYSQSAALLTDIAFPEKLLRLLLWNNKKRHLKFERSNFLKNVYRYNVYFAYIGCNIGCEIDKLRPVLIWKEHVNKNKTSENSYFVFPISSKIPKKRYYYNVELEINGVKNIIKINEGKRISTRRIVKPLLDKNTKKTIQIEENKINEIKESMKKYFSIQ